MDNPKQIMRAVATGIVRDGPAGRTVVRKGVTTAEAGSEMVVRHPHLWAPIRPDFPAEDVERDGGEAFVGATSAAGIAWAEEIRRLAQGLADRGFEVMTTGPDDRALPARVVDLALSIAESARLGSEGHVTALLGSKPAGSEVPQDAVLPPAAPVETEPGCTHPDCVLDHPHAGPAQLADDPAVTRSEVTADDVPPYESAPAAEKADPTTTEGRRAIREWARAHDIEVAATGPLPADVVMQYEASFAEPGELDGAEDDD